MARCRSRILALNSPKKSIKDDKIISLLAVDKDVAFEESLAKKILDSNAIISIRQCMLVNRKTGKCRDVIRYSYPLYYPEHPMFKESICRNPTPLAANAEATLTFEVVFAFDDELVFPDVSEIHISRTMLHDYWRYN